jgi:hypothetical protein
LNIKAENEVEFYKMKFGEALVAECELVYSCHSEAYRLYIKKDKARGFEAVALYNSHSDNTKGCWENNNNQPVTVDVIFYANACFDGVRQLEFNDCVHHPCLDRIGFLIKELRKVEIKTCPDADSVILEA